MDKNNPQSGKVEFQPKTVDTEKDFYHEIDRKRLRSSISCQVFIFTAVAVLAVGGVLVWVGVTRIKQRLIHLPLSEPTELSLTSAIDKLKSLVGPSAVAPNSLTTITLTQQEITSVLNDAIAGSQLPLTNFRVSLEAGQMTIYATTTAPLVADVAIIAQPKIVDNQIEFYATQVTIGTLPLPPAVVTKLTAPVLKATSQQLNRDGVRYQSVAITPGILTATAIVSK